MHAWGGAVSALTCTLSSHGAGLQGHSISQQHRRWPSARRSPSCPCCRCETLNRRRSLWSTPGTGRPWSRRRTRGSPRKRRHNSVRWQETSCRVSQQAVQSGMKTAREAGQRKRCRHNGDERNGAVHNRTVQVHNSSRG